MELKELLHCLSSFMKGEILMVRFKQLLQRKDKGGLKRGNRVD
jgi:hypothetical protein